MWRVMLGVVLLAVVGGCDDDGPTGPGNGAMAGTYALARVNGQALPFTTPGFGAPGESLTIDSATVQLTADGIARTVHYTRWQRGTTVTPQRATNGDHVAWSSVGADSVTFAADVFSARGGRVSGDSLVIAGATRYTFRRRS